MKSFLKEYIKMEERKVSALIVILTLLALLAGYLLFVYHDISDNFLDLLKTLIAGITGVSLISGLKDYFETKTENKEPP